jgi:hypothetical protein
MAMLYEDGQVISPPDGGKEHWPSAANARAAAWDRYVDRATTSVHGIRDNGITWTTHP